MAAVSKSYLLCGTILILVFLFEASEGHITLCSPDQFRCFNGKCIERTLFCDSANDCGDNSDEDYCDVLTSVPCPDPPGEAAWIRCAKTVFLDYKKCYPSVWNCDGTQDCEDNSDEINCDRFRSSQIPTVPTKRSLSEVPTKRPLSEVEEARANLTRYFLNKRMSGRFIGKWGPHPLRTALALFLTDKEFFSAGNATGEELSLQISLQLLSKLALKKKISTQKLSLFVNALTVSCMNPKDFLGVDVVAELRRRVNNSNYTNPFTILTLCNANDTMTEKDVANLQQLFDAHFRPVWTDTQALVTMALACISSRSNPFVDERILNEMAMELKKKQYRNGTIDNLRTTALVVQALISTDSYKKEFDYDGAVKFMLQEIKSKPVSVTDLYYVLPILNSKSLVDINSDHCPTLLNIDIDVLEKLRESPDERIPVQFSVYIGDDMDFFRMWKLKVPSNYTFYQLFEDLGSLEPIYKVQYSVSDGKPYVTGFTRYLDDAEDGKFWFIYTQSLKSTSSKPKLIEQSKIKKVRLIFKLRKLKN